jgi:hypothetical protein
VSGADEGGCAEGRPLNQPIETVADLEDLDSDCLASLIAHTAGILAWRSGEPHACKVLRNVADALDVTIQ